ncbi:RcnB family protein, partial [Escherichia coli]|uniref:RcnB family protein n=3 Tax=Pseudomonadota TaxID=1224 RepID=UPI001932FB11
WGYGYRRFTIGYTLNSILFSSQYWINDPFYYRLPEVYGPYRWVRYYNDALLVDIDTGEVVDTIYDIFW